MEDFFTQTEPLTPRPFSHPVGHILRQAREEKKMTLDDVSKRLCLSRQIIQALEAERYEDLPYGEAYLVGFVRSYCRLLDIDPHTIVEKLRGVLPHLTTHQELSFPAPLPHIRRPKKLTLFFSLVGLVFVSFFGHFLSQTPPHLGAHTLKEGSPLTASPLPTIEVKQQVSLKKSIHLAKKNPDHFFSPLFKQTMEGPLQLTSCQVNFSDLDFFSQKLEKIFSLGATRFRDSSPLILESTGKSWVEIRDKNGKIYMSKVLRPGEIFQVPENSPSLFMTTGNLGGLVARKGKQVLSHLGKPGEVRRGLHLSFEDLKRQTTKISE